MMAMSPAAPAKLLSPASVPWEASATPMALLDRAAALRGVNPALQDWLAAPARRWAGVALAELDARPPQLSEAVLRAGNEGRRVRVREARLRSGTGDRVADVLLTPLDEQQLLLELWPLSGTTTSRASETLRGFAHELRGPLAGMRGAAQLLRRRVGSADLAALADLVVGEVDRLAALSARLLDNQASVQTRPVNIHAVLERVAALLGGSAPQLRVRHDYDPSLPAVHIDADRVQQALLNLAQNALEAGASELLLRTRVEHALRIEGSAARLILRVDLADDGRGIDAALADTLFEPMVSGRADGHGLGLAIAREIAREHGGDLLCASRPGATVFSLLLPLAP